MNGWMPDGVCEERWEPGRHEGLQVPPQNNRNNVTLTLKSEELAKITVTLTVTRYG
jgi:hypothetical protein